MMFKSRTVPNSMAPAVGPQPPTAPIALEFLAQDAGVVGGALLPFVRDDAGTVGWAAAGLRLIPRAEPN